MTNEWNITALLCDYVQVADGKLYILGGGWSLCGPGPFTHGLAIKVDVPWHEANRRHYLEGVLLNADGQPVHVGEPPTEWRFRIDFEVGRPPGLLPGSPLDVPLAVNFPPLQLPPGAAYFWAISLNGQEVCRVRFATRPQAPESRPPTT
jgi:hypothetical protein